jgi:hypothetical protein
MQHDQDRVVITTNLTPHQKRKRMVFVRCANLDEILLSAIYDKVRWRLTKNERFLDEREVVRRKKVDSVNNGVWRSWETQTIQFSLL